MTDRTTSTPAATHDVVIVGGGHTGLTAAAYLARAGKSVILLERLEEVGGAAVSAQAFPGVEARLSRYSYLVSLLPQRIIDELGLDIRLARRRYSSYTPVPGDPAGAGLLIDNTDATATVSEAFRHHFGDDAFTLARQSASEDFSAIPSALGVPYSYWGLGGIDPEVYARAEVAGTIAQDIPANHSPRFAPVMQPPLDTGTAAAIVAALAWLGLGNNGG